MRSKKSWGGGIVCSIVWGGGVSCAFLGRGGGGKYKLYRGGGGALYHCVTSGGGYGLYKFVQNVGRGDVHYCGGERGRFCVSWGGGVFLPQNL